MKAVEQVANNRYEPRAGKSPAGLKRQKGVADDSDVMDACMD